MLNKISLSAVLTGLFFLASSSMAFPGFDRDHETLSGFTLTGTITYKDATGKSVTALFEIKPRRKSASHWTIDGKKYGGVAVGKSSDKKSHIIQLFNASSLENFFGKSKDTVITLEIPSALLSEEKGFHVEGGAISKASNFIFNLGANLFDEPSNTQTIERTTLKGMVVTALTKGATNPNPIKELVSIKLKLK